MKYKKSIKNIKKKLLTGFAIALTALFASVPAVDAFAADTVSLESSELEALRIKKEAAQAAYDAALADKLMAEDEVENARIALKDAQDNYEDVRERYATGFAGFLQWVIETEDDPVKAEDARRVLEEAFAGEQQISADDPANITRMLYMADWLEELAEHFRSNYGVEADTSHAAMRLAQAGFGEYSGEQAYYDALFENADDKEAFVFPDQNVLIEKAYDEMAFENERIPATKNKGIFKGFWCINTDLASAQQEGMPLLEGLSKQVQDRPYYSYWYEKIRGYDSGDGFLYVFEDGEEMYSRLPIQTDPQMEPLPIIMVPYVDEDGEEMYTGLPIQTDPQMETLPIITVPYVDYAEPSFQGFKDVNEDYMAEILKTGNTFFKGNFGAGNETIDYSLIFENNLLIVINYSKGITIGNALGVGNTGKNESLGVVFNGKGTYTIAEYASALREYYSMTDPLAAKAYLSSKNDDLDNARRQLAGAEGLLATAYGTLKGAEKEYEEAAGYADVVSEVQETPYSAAEAAPESVVPATQYITGQSPVGAEAQEAQATQAATKARGQEVMLSREETLEKSPGAEAQGARAPEGQAVTLSREDTFAETAQAAGGVLQLPVSEYEHVRTDEVYKAQQEDSVSVNEPALTATVMKEEPAAEAAAPATEPAISSEAAAAGAPEKEAGLQSSSEKDKQKNGVLAEVLSYIFNGGAIAFIIPAGFRRKKKTGEMLQGEC